MNNKQIFENVFGGHELNHEELNKLKSQVEKVYEVMTGHKPNLEERDFNNYLNSCRVIYTLQQEAIEWHTKQIY